MRIDPAPRQRGFTLVEVVVACAVAAVLAAVALPTYRGTVMKSRRADAVAALSRLQAAEERYRASHGFYGADLGALGVGARSAEGLYSIEVALTGAEAYRAQALAVAGTSQAADGDCTRIVVDVEIGFARRGPTERCWNR